MEIAANFTNPEQISNYVDFDELKLTIEFPEIFISMENGQSLEGNLTFRLPIKPQVQPPNGRKVIMELGTHLRNVGIVHAIFCVWLGMFSKHTLQILWSTINTFQLIVHLPLFYVALPDLVIDFSANF